MADRSLGTWPERRAGMTPDREAFSHEGRSVTYAQFRDLVESLASGLAARGVTRGDRVAFLGTNSIELAVTLFASARLGAIFLPLNTRLATPEVAWILSDAAPRFVIHTRDRVPPYDHTIAFTPDGGHGLDHVSAAGAAPRTHSAPSDVVMVQYTSGTSGRPKGVMLTHENITFNAFNLLLDVDLGSDEVALVTAPLFHTAALNQVLLPTFLKGGLSLIEGAFDPARSLDLIETNAVTLLFGVASMYQAIARQPGFPTADLASLRTALSGGAPIPLALLETWAAKGVPLIQGYGLTEASPGATMLRPADALTRLGSAGTPCFFTDVRVVAVDSTVAAPGVPGEVQVRGPNVSPGYWGHASDTSGQDGWLHTGDLATRDADGFLTIVDRLKDMFISGGENVYPAEVEQALYSHPDVAEVAVIGVPDERWGEGGRALVVRRDGSQVTVDDLLAHLGHELARYKIPRDIVFVETLPYNGSGKLMKSRLREAHGTPIIQEDS